ncbi:ABC transporter ATP-binding protein [Catellatospora citrea]|uniref:ABC transporter ATP-binding protein n=1 Tax=Catellatospora citrea TaxID=53366 RepID=UPI0033F98288
MTLLEIQDLHVDYKIAGGLLPAVRGVDLTVGKGQILGVAGESGCGKSTLAGAVLRLLPASTRVRGRISLHGEDVLGMSWGRLRAVRWSEASIVFQGAMSGLNPVHRIGDQIAEPILLHGTPAQRKAGRKALAGKVGELLESVGVPAWRAQSYPHELSGGQRQRVMIAMALACEPDLIIADEPTTALDVMVQAQVMALLKSLVTERGVGMMLISHDLSVLSHVCDRVAVMYAGRVVEEGPAGTLFTDACHPYAKALAGAFPVIGDMASRRAPRGLPGDPPYPLDLPGGCPFHPRCAVAIEQCATEDVRLRPAAPGRAAACVHVGVASESATALENLR